MNQKKDFLDVALSTFFRSGKGNKIRRSVRKIVGHLAEHSVTAQEAILKRIATTMTRECFSKSKETKEKFWQRDLLLGDSIAEQMLKGKDVPFLCRNFIGVDPLLITEEENFAARIFLASRFFAYVGSSLHLTLEFCQIVFSYLVKQEEKRVQEKGETAHDETEMNLRKAIVLSMCAPCAEEATQKRWVINLIEASHRGNEEAEQYYSAATDQCIDAHIAMSRELGRLTIENRRQVRVIPQSLLDRECPDKMQQLAGVDWENLRIVMPDNLMDKIEQRDKRVADDWQRDTTAAGGFLEWFNSHIPQIGARFDELSNAVLTKQRYGVRPMGFDSFLVNISALRCIGITSFSFYPEGEQFPNLKIQVTVRKSGLGLCQLWMHLQDFELSAVDDVFLNWRDFNVITLRSMLEYIIVDALHRIVVAKPKKDLGDGEVNRPEEASDFTPTTKVRVRPFIRRLPLGFEPSAEAREQAFLQLGWSLMAGMTFVRSHDRWAGLPAGKPAPLFKYTDEFVRNSIA